MTQYHTNGRENSRNCARFPPLLGERAGVRASVSSNPILGVRGSLLQIRDPQSAIRNRSERPYVGCYGPKLQGVTQCRIRCPHLARFLVFPKRSVSRLSPSLQSFFSPVVEYLRRQFQRPPNRPAAPTS